LFTAYNFAGAQDLLQATRDQRVQDSLAQIGESSNADAWHSEKTYLTRFIGMDYNKVMPDIEMYLQNKMHMASVDALFGMDNGWMRVAYTPQVEDGPQRFISILAKLDAKGKIQQMKIKGDWSLLVPLFCDYWPTKLDFNNVKKGELVSVFNLDEKISLSSSISGSTSFITITKTNH